MPASRISADLGDSVKEIGSSIATVGDRADPGQHADDGAEQYADEAVGRYLERERDRKADRQDWKAHPSRATGSARWVSVRPSA